MLQKGGWFRKGGMNPLTNYSPIFSKINRTAMASPLYCGGDPAMVNQK